MKYNDTIDKFYNDEEHMGSFDEEDISVGTGLVGAPACGDVMKLQLKIENEIIVDAKMLVFGCGSAKASSAFATKEIIGKTIEEALLIRDEDIAKFLGLPTVKYHCSVLAESAIKRAVEDYRKKNQQAKQENQIKQFNNSSSETLEKPRINNEFFINISVDAEHYIKKILAKLGKPVIGIRIDLEESGCGLSYKIRYMEDISKIMSNDIIHKTKEGLCIFINQSIAKIINGTTMDFKEEGLKAGIIFNNPNEVSKCGCGMNFKTEENKDIKDNCN